MKVSGLGQAAPASHQRLMGVEVGEDLSGQNRLLSNVLASWGAQAVFIVTGFVMPRLIDDRLGQESLGVWDFCWSLITYFTLVQGGIVSSINRHVAKHRANGDLEGVNIVASSVTAMLLVMAIAVVALTIVAILLIPALFAQKLGRNLVEAQWVVFILGMSLSLQVSRGVFGGVLTGCHRWDLHHLVNAEVRIFEAMVMIGVVLSGGGLRGLALGSFISEFVGVAARVHYAKKVLPTLRIRLSTARMAVAKNMIRFGSKTFLPVIGELVVNQTASLLVIGYLGPSALALFARPRNLVRQGQIVVYRFASVLTPTASALHAREGEEPLRRLLVEGCRQAGFISFPLVTVLTIMGGPLMGLWMGSKYDDPWLPLVLALGALPNLLQLPAWGILNGINAHGWPGFIKLLSSLLSICGMWLVLGPLGQGIVGAAVVLSILSAMEGLLILLLTTKRLKVPFGTFCRKAWVRPVIVAIPLWVGLLLTRLSLSGQPMWQTLALLSAGMISFVYSNWRWALTKEQRAGVLKRFAGSGSWIDP